MKRLILYAKVYFLRFNRSEKSDLEGENGNYEKRAIEDMVFFLPCSGDFFETLINSFFKDK